MSVNRVFATNDSGRNESIVTQTLSLPPASPAATVVFVPVPLNYSQWQNYLYQMAYAWARLIVAPPRHEQLLTARWNN